VTRSRNRYLDGLVEGKYVAQHTGSQVPHAQFAVLSSRYNNRATVKYPTGQGGGRAGALVRQFADQLSGRKISNGESIAVRARYDYSAVHDGEELQFIRSAPGDMRDESCAFEKGIPCIA